MRIKKSIFGCGMALALTAGVVNAQDPADSEKKPLPAWLDNIYFGGSVGLTTSITDVKVYDLYPVLTYRNEYGYGGNLYAGYSFSSVISVEGHLAGYSVNGTSRKHKVWFNSQVFAPSAHLKVNFTNMIFSGSSNKDRKWSISGYSGLGLSSFKTELRSLVAGDDTDPIVGYEGYTDATLEDANRTQEITIPMGLQLNYKLNAHLDIYADLRMSYVMTDKLDAFIPAGSITRSEYYSYHAIGVNYRFKDKWVKPEDKLMDDIARLDSVLDGFVDSDGDGVMDAYDKDNKTVEGAIVDGGGNAMDTDGDGVADYLDQERLSLCTEVDENGVALDTDGDGIPNCKDKEPNTPADAQVDANGKQISTIGGATASTNEGESTGGADVGLPSVYFTLNSTSINYTNYPSLTQVAKFLKNNPNAKLSIVGHTDATGAADYNKKLGEKRAQAVIDHLVKIYGIDASRLSASSKGNSEILAKGKGNVNRRVDFLLTK